MKYIKKGPGLKHTFMNIKHAQYHQTKQKQNLNHTCCYVNLLQKYFFSHLFHENIEFRTPEM